jgi:predicted GNAT superfamily acetyltransferase
MTSPQGESSSEDVEIRLLSSPVELEEASEILMQVWGSNTPIVSREMLRAVHHSGGYVSGAFEHGRIVGASFGWLARHDGEPALHSHVTGLLAGVRHLGLGRLMKFHQREWASARGISWITWTFDPLVRTNAWFNIGVLGGEIAEYLPNFYGEMTDSINANDESDRVLVAWRVDGTQTPTATDPESRQQVSTPEDIVTLRRTDPHATLKWRHEVRAALMTALTNGFVVVDFTKDGSYQLERPL